ncbi:sulfite exporter TauE/SafE family protein [Roseiterribacter gracilis]|uniref:Probable membrane transporter protein n=1 Tax=Roseiterribacter gracilis TaxID=2812848 RepID=A0A8S8XBP3_9PROT|nr:membrane protein [Rhodospirillales bacterium TMPK1]
MQLDSHIAAILATFLLAGFVKGVTGLGLPTVAIGLLSLVMRPADAATLVVIPSLVTNLWQMTSGPALRPIARRLWPMMLGIFAGTWAFGGVLTGSHASAAITGLGVVLLLYAAFGLLRLRLPHVATRTELVLSPVIGAATGAVTGATGVFVIPAVPYLQALGFERDELVQALGMSFTVSTIALAIMLAGTGTLGALALSSLAALIPALIGMEIGNRVRKRVEPTLFRKIFFAGLALLGAHLLLR